MLSVQFNEKKTKNRWERLSNVFAVSEFYRRVSTKIMLGVYVIVKKEAVPLNESMELWDGRTGLNYLVKGSIENLRNSLKVAGKRKWNFRGFKWRILIDLRIEDIRLEKKK